MVQQVHDFIEPDHIRKVINIMGSSLINFVVIYLFFFPLALIALRKKGLQQSNNVLYFFIILGFCIGGALTWSFLSQKLNSVQPFYFALKTMPVLIFISVIQIDKPVIKYAVLSIILLFAGFNIQGSINANLKNESKKTNTAAGSFAAKYIDIGSVTAYIKDSSDYRTTFNYYSTCYCLGNYLCVENDRFFPISISDYNLPVVKDSLAQALNAEGNRMGIFYRFVDKQKQAGSFVSIEKSQIDFIKKYHIKNILLSAKATLPSSLMPLTDSTMIVVPVNGEKIVRLNYHEAK
jgi:hypothetical protein